MRILLTETADRRFGPLLLDAVPDVELVVMTADGTLRDGAPWEGADVEVAWPTADRFEEGSPVRP
jgi:hypothetical protein